MKIKPAPIVSVEASTQVYHAKAGRRWTLAMRARRFTRAAMQDCAIIVADRLQRPGWDKACFPGWD